MDQILLVTAAVLAANMLTLAFFWGCWQLRNVYDDKDARPLALGAVIMPLLLVAAGFFVYR